MRVGLVAVVALVCSGLGAQAQNNVRYFNGVYGLLEDIETDAFLKETRAGNKVVSAELDVCHAPSPGSPLRDRFVVALKPQGNRLVGTGQTQEGKLPVLVDLTRAGSGNEFSFEGTVKLGERAFKASSGDVSDMSAKDFQEQAATDETITESPADFHEVTPGTVAFRVARASLADFLKALRAEKAKIQAYSIAPSCEALRRGYVDVQTEVDPERAVALVAKARSLPGVSRAGWTSGGLDLSRSLRFAAKGWRGDGGKLDRDKLGKTIAEATAKSLGGAVSETEWDDVTGELTVVVRRPDATVPGLGLTEVIGVPLIVSADRPGATDVLVLRIGRLEGELEDAGDGPRLTIATNQGTDETQEPAGSDALQAALAKELKAEIWDSGTDSWVK